MKKSSILRLIMKTLFDRNTITSLLSSLLLTTALFTMNPAAHAQENSFDTIPLNGLASFTKLRQEYYIGALYLETLSQDSGELYDFGGRKRMEMRITIDRWSPRRFSQQWNQSILINNDQEMLEDFAEAIAKFVRMPKDNLVAGDRITIDMDPNSYTSVYLNNHLMFTVDDNAFFDVLLDTWIGQRPPSTEFRENIITLPTDQAGTELLTRYEALSPLQERVDAVASWAENPDTPIASASSNEPEESPEPSVAAIPPPDSDTTVVARRSSTPAAAAPAVVAPAPETEVEMDAPTPEMDFDQPAIASSEVVVAEAEETEQESTVESTEASTAEPTAPVAETAAASEQDSQDALAKLSANNTTRPETPAAAPAPAEAPLANLSANQSPKDQQQNRLERIYRANVLKLTHLNTKYPKRARDFNQEGLVVIKVTVNRKGEVTDTVVETESEHERLNTAARQAIDRSSPYPEMPDTLEVQQVVVTLPFNFKL